MLGVVRDLRSPRSLGTPDEAAAYQEHLLAEYVLARLAMAWPTGRSAARSRRWSSSWSMRASLAVDHGPPEHVADEAIENAYQRAAERAAARFKE